MLIINHNTTPTKGYVEYIDHDHDYLSGKFFDEKVNFIKVRLVLEQPNSYIVLFKGQRLYLAKEYFTFYPHNKEVVESIKYFRKIESEIKKLQRKLKRGYHLLDNKK